MIQRATGIFVILLWASSMTALFLRDIRPAWTAQDLPPAFSEEWSGQDQQFGIFNALGERLGTSWTQFRSLSDMRLVEGAHLIREIGGFGPLLVQTSMKYDAATDRLYEFRVRVDGVPQRVVVEGELVGSEIVCDVQVGLSRRAFHVDADVAGVMGESLRPFAALPELHVGQSWRLYMVDPLSLMLGGRASPKPVIVRVTRREEIRHQGETVQAFVVEWPASRSWVDEHGRVLRTQLDVPLIGQITISGEPFDPRQLQQARDEIPIGFTPAGTEFSRSGS